MGWIPLHDEHPLVKVGTKFVPIKGQKDKIRTITKVLKYDDETIVNFTTEGIDKEDSWFITTKHQFDEDGWTDSWAVIMYDEGEWI